MLARSTAAMFAMVPYRRCPRLLGRASASNGRRSSREQVEHGRVLGHLERGHQGIQDDARFPAVHDVVVGGVTQVRALAVPALVRGEASGSVSEQRKSAVRLYQTPFTSRL